MPPRRRLQLTQESVEQQFQQIHLLDPSSSTENLEQLGPIIKQIHTNRQQEAYLRTLQTLVESKDAEIRNICGDNYQDFISSVSTLFNIKSYTTNLRDKITTLDSSVTQVGQTLVEKKRSLLEAKKTAANLDEAIDILQASLRVLDVVSQVGAMIRDEKYWSALRSLEEIQSMPSSSLLQTPLFQYVLSSLPSLRSQIKDAATASMKQWLLVIRNTSGEVGRLALQNMEARARKWRSRREKDPLLKLSRVGSAVEVVTNEKAEYNVLQNEKVNIDCKPLHQCILVYTALDAIGELQKSYQGDRKAQSDLILPSFLHLSNLPVLTEEVTGFFIIESEVLRTTRNFRSERDVEELWDTVNGGLSDIVGQKLQNETDPEAFVKVKDSLLAFATTMESYSYNTTQLHSFVLVLFEKYASLLEKQFGTRFDTVIMQNDYLPKHVQNEAERDSALSKVWLSRSESAKLTRMAVPTNLPWSEAFHASCQTTRDFVKNFYQFLEGISQHHRDVDELLGRSLDNLLIHHISENMEKWLNKTSTLSQVAQILTDLEYFEVACPELETSVTTLRSNQRGGVVRITAASSFSKTLKQATARITTIINSKLDDFFELSEYNWTPRNREDTPSMYLYELINWLTTVVDSLAVKDTYKDEAYKGAAQYIADCLMDFLVGKNIPMVSENAISNILIDVDFIEAEFKRIDRGHLCTTFTELRLTASIPLMDVVQEYLVPGVRQASYSVVKPKRLQALLEKLAKYCASIRDSGTREKGERRRKEAEAVGHIYPGEYR